MLLLAKKGLNAIKLCINRVHSGPRPSNIVPPRSFVARGNKYLGPWAHLLTRLIYNHFTFLPNHIYELYSSTKSVLPLSLSFSARCHSISFAQKVLKRIALSVFSLSSISDVVRQRSDVPLLLNLLWRLWALPPLPRRGGVHVQDVHVHRLVLVEARGQRALPEGHRVPLPWDELALDVGDVHEEVLLRGL